MLLKKYLAYAEHSSEQNLSNDQEMLFESRVSQGKDNSLASSIGAALEERGYKVTRLLGSSDYRIDLAVANADDEDNYLLAIETDGPVYQAASTVRDRERLRRQVLESLGWKVHRVYARDWVRNPKLEFERILALL
jgi:Zn-dependent oligopeptidase